MGETHWKDNVDNIHNNENQVANACKVVGVRGHDQSDGDEVVRQHLPVILSLLLNVDDVDLLDPESQLCEIIKLHSAANLSAGPVCPELGHVEKVGGGVPDVLRQVSKRKRTVFSRKEGQSRTYHAKRPKEAVIANHPRLFSKSRLVLNRRDSPAPSQGTQNALHEAIAQSSEEHQIVEHVVNVIEANRVLSSRGVVVGQPQEKPCEGPGSWNHQLGEVEKDNEIANDSWCHISMGILSPLDELMGNEAAYPLGCREAAA